MGIRDVLEGRMDAPRSLGVGAGVGVAIWEARRERVMALSILGCPVPRGGPMEEVKRLSGDVSIARYRSPSHSSRPTRMNIKN